MEEGVAGGNFWEERVRQALSITITAASASLLSLLSLPLFSLCSGSSILYCSYVLLCMCAVCYIFVFVLLAETKTGSVAVHSAKGSETFWEGHTER